MAQDFGVDVRGLVGDAAFASRIDVRTLDDLVPGMKMDGSCRSASGSQPRRRHRRFEQRAVCREALDLQGGATA